MPHQLLVYFIVINALGLSLYGLDKYLSKHKGSQRISEQTLMWLARLGGGAGCWLGMLLFRHKTKHVRFKVWIPIWTILWTALILAWFWKKDSLCN